MGQLFLETFLVLLALWPAVKGNVQSILSAVQFAVNHLFHIHDMKWKQKMHPILMMESQVKLANINNNLHVLQI